MSTVVTALGHEWEARMVALVDSLPGIDVGRRCVDLAELVSAVAAGHGDVALVSLELRGLDRDALHQLDLAGVHVVGASAEGDEDSERRLRQLGLTRVVHLGTPADELADLLGVARRGPAPGAATLAGTVGAGPTSTGGVAVATDDPQAGPPRPTDEPPPAPEAGRARGRVVCVWGPTGAPGRTTVAVNLAAELAGSGVPTLLVDVDTYGASVAQALSMIDEAPGAAAAVRASEAGSLDLPTLARVAPEVLPGLRVLSGIPTPARWTELRAAAVEHVLDLSRDLAPLVVVDCGFSIEDDEELSYDTLAPRRNATTLVALEAADEILVVGAGDPVGLQRMVRAVQALADLPVVAPRPVVNRVRASAVGSDPQRRIADSLRRFAGLERIAFLPDDPASTDAAMLAGRTLAETAPGSPLRAALRELAGALAGRALPRPSRTGSRLLRR
ncbi:P-loop NTPase [Janibacter alkaliphilus]|uniref:MinD-like ATPase involved in chromosome partitioning or flagellar assembly n=1 Tax=Janibacter alkaliphilus TaxID=1069963 RepID=A0A852WZG2_9MICO|nr:MinD-like ATPase involved in chromosome partitioning or flagellar assembly [Janibacter alkaliphilus]